MSTVYNLSARLCAAFFILLFCSTAFAGPAKVEVCHIPAGNYDNFHTIKINEKALAAHLAHFDIVGPCNSLCDQLCDDGNACTIDHGGDCETNGCYAASEPVDCSDGNLCTDDLCDPDQGCFNPVAVTCEAPNLCVSSTCDPTQGVCEETPVLCDDGETCNPDTGGCEQDNACPCFDQALIDSLGAIIPGQCGNDTGLAAAFFEDGSLTCSGDGCGTTNPSCGYFDATTGANVDIGVTGDEDQACRSLIVSNCP
jgi:hypothetical protein